LKRFVDEAGEVVPFVVKSIPPEENEKILRKCRDMNGAVDTISHSNQMIVACMAEPDLQDAELCEYYGVMDPAMVPGRMFTIGEKQLIMDAISEINDLKDAKTLLDEAKNS